MRGVDALAEACEPQDNPTEGAAGTTTLSDDMVNKIADKVVQKLQQTDQSAGTEEGSAGSEEGSAGSAGSEEGSAGSAGSEEGGGADD